MKRTPLAIGVLGVLSWSTPAWAALQVFISNEVSGTGVAARTAVDALNDDWLASALASGTCAAETGSVVDGNWPYVLQSVTGNRVGALLYDVDGTLPFGTLASTQGYAYFAYSGTMQDSSPKPQSLYLANEACYTENGGSTRSRNGVLFSFDQPATAFGAWFGDLETRSDGQGTAAVVRLYDSASAQIGADIVIPASTADQSLCGGTYVGCGNRTTRWVGFVADAATPVSRMLVVVGDNDGGYYSHGNAEHISFIGPTLVSCSPGG